MEPTVPDLTVEVFLSAATSMPNAYLDEKEFSHIYVRKGPRAVIFPDGAQTFDVVFQVARVEAKKPGDGALRRIIERVDRFSSSSLPIYVENLFNEDAVQGLLASDLGFELVDVPISPAPCLFRAAPCKIQESDEQP